MGNNHGDYDFQEFIKSWSHGVHHTFLIIDFNLPQWRLESSLQSCQIYCKASVQSVGEVYSSARVDWLKIVQPDKTHMQARA